MRLRRARTPEPFEGRLYAEPIPGLEGLAVTVTVNGREIPAQMGTRPDDAHPGRPMRGRRAPAIPVPVAEPVKKRGRR